MRKIKQIIIHHSASPAHTTTVDLVRKWHVEDRGWKDIGYHYMIDENGEVHRGREDKIIGAHCKGNNRFTLGVCVFGNYQNEQMKPIVFESLRNLVSGLKTRYGLQSGDIYGHRDFGKTVCPGDNLYRMLDELRRKV